MTKITDPITGKVYNVARMNDDPKPYPICGAKNRSGFPCGYIAGWGTKHKGAGRCRKHGGMNQQPGSVYKTGLASNITYPGIQVELDRLRADRDVFNMRDHIFLMEAIATVILQGAKTSDDLFPVVKVIAEATKAIQKLDEIEHGRRLVIELPEVKLILDQVKEVVFRHISDSYTRQLIARDLIEIPVGGASFPDQSSNLIPALESGVAMEGRSGQGDED